MHRRGALLLGTILAATVATLSAHLRVERTFPAADATIAVPPDRIQVWFSQAPTLSVSTLELEGPRGPVELGKVVAGKTDDKPDRSIVAPVTRTLAAGRYVAKWKTAGLDGHIQNGTFEFTFTPASR